MTVRTIALLVIAAGSMIGPALADEAVHLTPPLYREQARPTASVRPASELVTTPRLVPTAAESRRVVATAVSAE
ncbi:MULTISPECIES: hypothetical protein [Methylobacterium]|uniref:Uncharacterized protein n=1 Tax=Methylobacterium longum TaxID=767694 RepID=A0ABT8ANY6_9HYPH|nr:MULTISPECIES: hypothetical protein [Methylobacterium]MCJ2103531.1 hypothetical protein [Methylobacterium sp. E-046]MDN3571271.1 hypothetical protein [Methylobacterium longum]GJE09119.1 hypothetical protein FOHLNKBM_0139 [Methylobacterium longum]